jgi:cytochrome c-type biogenesis protein CcmH
MTWVLAIALALAAFALAAFVFRVPKQGWTTFAAALALGLAGYAMQAIPGMPGAPAAGAGAPDEVDWAFVDARKEMVAEDKVSHSPMMLTADAFARNGQYANAVGLLRAVVARDPQDGEAWLALGNALVEHADGALTQPALLAYRRAQEVEPESVGPGYFLGLSLIRQGRIAEARGVWQSTLETSGEHAAGREALAARLQRLDELLANQGTVPR